MIFRRDILRDIIISQAANGPYLVRVGCATLSYANARILCQDLLTYLRNPKSIEEEYEKKMREGARAIPGTALNAPVPLGDPDRQAEETCETTQAEL